MAIDIDVLVKLCKCHDLDGVRKYLVKYERELKRSKDGLNVLDSEGVLPLHAAILSGNVGIVRHLMEYGVDILLRDNICGNTALHLATYNGYKDIVDAILGVVERHSGNCNAQKSHVINCDVMNELGYTPLHYACMNGNSHMIQALVVSGKFKINTIDAGPYGRSPLMHTFLHIKEKGNEGAKYLLRLLEMDCNIIDKMGNSLLHHICDSGDMEVMNAFMDRRSMTSLSPHILFDVNMRNHLGETALHVACRQNAVDIVRYLVSVLGADIEAKGINDRTPYLEAAHYGAEKVMHYFLHENKLLKTDVFDCNGDSALHLAVRVLAVDTLSELLENQFIDEQVHNRSGYNALHLACCGVEDSICCVKELLEKSDLISQPTSIGGDSALHLACKNGLYNIAKFVTDYSVSNKHDLANFANNDQETPLYLACIYGYTNIAEYLLQKCKIDFNVMVKNPVKFLEMADVDYDFDILINIIECGGGVGWYGKKQKFVNGVNNWLKDTNYDSTIYAYGISIDGFFSEELTLKHNIADNVICHNFDKAYGIASASPELQTHLLKMLMIYCEFPNVMKVDNIEKIDTLMHFYDAVLDETNNDIVADRLKGYAELYDSWASDQVDITGIVREVQEVIL